VKNQENKFRQALAKVLRVSPQEMKARVEAEKATKKRKPKTSASGRVRGDKG